MTWPPLYSKKFNEYLALRRSFTAACKAVALDRFRDLLTVGCPTCGGLINEAFSCHQAAWIRNLRRLDNLRYMARRDFHSFSALQRGMKAPQKSEPIQLRPTRNP